MSKVTFYIKLFLFHCAFMASFGIGQIVENQKQGVSESMSNKNDSIKYVLEEKDKPSTNLNNTIKETNDAETPVNSKSKKVLFNINPISKAVKAVSKDKEYSLDLSGDVKCTLSANDSMLCRFPMLLKDLTERSKFDSNSSSSRPDITNTDVNENHVSAAKTINSSSSKVLDSKLDLDINSSLSVSNISTSTQVASDALNEESNYLRNIDQREKSLVSSSQVKYNSNVSEFNKSISNYNSSNTKISSFNKSIEVPITNYESKSSQTPFSSSISNTHKKAKDETKTPVTIGASESLIHTIKPNSTYTVLQNTNKMENQGVVKSLETIGSNVSTQSSTVLSEQRDNSESKESDSNMGASDQNHSFGLDEEGSVLRTKQLSESTIYNEHDHTTSHSSPIYDSSLIEGFASKNQSSVAFSRPKNDSSLALNLLSQHDNSLVQSKEKGSKSETMISSTSNTSKKSSTGHATISYFGLAATLYFWIL